MNFLSRKVRTKETERIDDRVIHREVEITVQREWLSVNAHGHGEDRAQDIAGERQAETPVLELPPFTKLE